MDMEESYLGYTALCLMQSNVYNEYIMPTQTYFPSHTRAFHLFLSSCLLHPVSNTHLYTPTGIKRYQTQSELGEGCACVWGGGWRRITSTIAISIQIFQAGLRKSLRSGAFITSLASQPSAHLQPTAASSFGGVELGLLAESGENTIFTWLLFICGMKTSQHQAEVRHTWKGRACQLFIHFSSSENIYMSLPLCLLPEYVDVYVSPVIIQCGFFFLIIITILTAGCQNVNGAGRTHVSENMLDKGGGKKK